MRIAPISTQSVSAGQPLPVVVIPLQALKDALANAHSSASQAALIALAAGKTLEASVQARLVDSQALLDVGGAQIELPLPDALTPGTQLRLRTLPTGALTLAVETEAWAETADLTPAARLLTQLAASAARNGLEPIAVSLVAEPQSSAGLAASLEDALSHSGLFYESHLEAWAEGRRDFASIAREPQAALADRGSQVRFMAGDSQGAFETPTSTESARVSIAAEAVTLVQNQLNALETGTATCRAEVWPQQFAQLSVGPERNARGNADLERAWSARIRLELPQLGSISATISLAEGAVSARLCADSAAGEATLRTASPLLLRSFADAGLNPRSIEVRRDVV